MATKRSLTPAVLVAFALAGCDPDDAPAPRPASEPGAWRARLRTALYERTAKDGTRWGRDRLDPLLTHSTEHLLSGPSRATALSALDEFVVATAPGKGSPVERALVQRDLLAVHDWALQPIVTPGWKATPAGARAALCAHLAGAIRLAAPPP